MTREQAAAFLRVSVRTIGHWETGRARPSYAAFKLLRTYRHGDLIHPAWADCSINHRGALVTPEGHEIKPADLAWLTLLFRRAEAMGPLLRERDQLRQRLQDTEQATAGEAGRGLGLVYYITSDTGTSENQLYQGFCLPYRQHCHGAKMGPKWPHERDHSQDQFEAPDACSGGGQGTGRVAGRVPQRLHPVRRIGTGEKDSQRVGRSCRRAQAQGQAQAGRANGFYAVLGRSRGDDCQASAGQGWPQRKLPLWEWSQGQALPSGVDLNSDASRNVGGCPVKRQSDPDYLRSALARAYEMRDVIEQMRSETPTTLEEKVHFASMLETANTFIGYYRRELSLIARRGGHGHRVQGAALGHAGARLRRVEQA